MSKADQLFVRMCTDILDHGTTTEGQKVRPHWEDGTPAYTIKNFGVTARYDLREEFPALTLRRTALKSAMDEIHTLLRIAYEKYSDDDDFINVSAAGTYIKRVKPEFNTYAYGFAKLSDLLRAFPDRYEMKKVPTTGNASVIMYRCR